jgi:hypothetical protein
VRLHRGDDRAAVRLLVLARVPADRQGRRLVLCPPTFAGSRGGPAKPR